MELYNFLRGVLAWTATIACLWPVNAPLLAFAFKVQQGSKTIDMDNDEYWTRSFVTSLVLAIVTAGFIFLDFVLVDWAELTEGVVHLVVYLGYVPVAVWILTLFFAMDDLAEGFSLFVIYVYLPVFVVFLLNSGLGLLSENLRFWDWFLNWVYPWLKEAKS